MTTTAVTKPRPKGRMTAAAILRGGSRQDEERDLAVHMGHMIRERRKGMGLSQGKLGDALGITFQQVQKYEKGVNRASGPTLQRMARVLKVPIDYFFPQDGEPLFAHPGMPRPMLRRIDDLARRVGELADKLAALVDELSTQERNKAP